MDAILRFVGLLSTALSIALVIVMLLTFRRERRIGALSLLLSGALSLIMLPVFVLLSGARLNLLVAVPLLLLGMLIGSLRGFTTRLSWRGDHIVARHSVWFLVGWAISLILAQLLVLIGSALAAAVGLMPLCLSTGTQVAIAGNLLLRRLLMRPPSPQRPATLPER
ncbi:MAG: hypothetical protein JXC32_17160 [Anaerolineae bacterium]|nr:hypothetical protein [Anaerolineae bacterium]